jgi:phage terminase small subunit
MSDGEWENELDAKERRFVSEYLIDLDPCRAALAAGYSASMAKSKAYQWVSNSKTKPLVFAAIQNAMKARAERTEITADRVLKELGRIGFSDIRKAVKWHSALVTEEDNPDGGDIAVVKRIVTNQVEIIASEDIDGETAAAISEISQNTSGGLKIKFHDKRAALVDIGKHLGMFVEKHEHTGNVSLTFSSDDEKL